jgi:hypothetical protein
VVSWAGTMSVPTSRNFELPCVMDWDSTSYTDTVRAFKDRKIL